MRLLSIAACSALLAACATEPVLRDTLPPGLPTAATPAEPAVAANVTTLQADRDFVFKGGFERVRFTRGEPLPVIGWRTVDGRPHAVVVSANRKYAVQVAPDGTLHPKVYNAIGFNRGMGTMVYNFQADPPGARLLPATAP